MVIKWSYFRKKTEIIDSRTTEKWTAKCVHNCNSITGSRKAKSKEKMKYRLVRSINSTPWSKWSSLLSRSFISKNHLHYKIFQIQSEEIISTDFFWPESKNKFENVGLRSQILCTKHESFMQGKQKPCKRIEEVAYWAGTVRTSTLWSRLLLLVLVL